MVLFGLDNMMLNGFYLISSFSLRSKDFLHEQVTFLLNPPSKLLLEQLGHRNSNWVFGGFLFIVPHNMYEEFKFLDFINFPDEWLSHKPSVIGLCWYGKNEGIGSYRNSWRDRTGYADWFAPIFYEEIISLGFFWERKIFIKV